jgi:hypothetical protein
MNQKFSSAWKSKEVIPVRVNLINEPLHDSHEQSMYRPVWLLHHTVHLVPPYGENLDYDGGEEDEGQIDAAVPNVAIIEVSCRHDHIWNDTLLSNELYLDGV